MSATQSAPTPTPAEEARRLFELFPRQRAPDRPNLTMVRLGVPFQVHTGVSPDQCLPSPDDYVWPTQGTRAYEWVQRLALAISLRRNVYVWGPPGTGKDAVFHKLSAEMGIPAFYTGIVPNQDISHMFYSRTLDAQGTGWTYGTLFQAATEGILCADGVRRAPMIVFGDIDRADDDQLEWLRLLLDSIQGRLKCPDGTLVPLFEDEEGNKPFFGFTANSSGSGDASGRMSSRTLDASIVNRMGRAIAAADYLDWKDEVKVAKALYPAWPAAELSLLGKCVDIWRTNISKGKLEGEFTIRSLQEIARERMDLEVLRPGAKDLLACALRAWLDFFDADNAVVAARLVSSHINVEK